MELFFLRGKPIYGDVPYRSGAGWKLCNGEPWRKDPGIYFCDPWKDRDREKRKHPACDNGGCVPD